MTDLANNTATASVTIQVDAAIDTSVAAVDALSGESELDALLAALKTYTDNEHRPERRGRGGV